VRGHLINLDPLELLCNGTTPAPVRRKLSGRSEIDLFLKIRFQKADKVLQTFREPRYDWILLERSAEP
jgi:hypothetical protein